MYYNLASKNDSFNLIWKLPQSPKHSSTNSTQNSQDRANTACLDHEILRTSGHDKEEYNSGPSCKKIMNNKFSLKVKMLLARAMEIGLDGIDSWCVWWVRLWPFMQFKFSLVSLQNKTFILLLLLVLIFFPTIRALFCPFKR